MVIVKSFLLICIALAYPLIPGALFLGCIKKKKEEYRLAPVYLCGALLCGFLFGVAAFFGVRLAIPLSAFSKAVLILAILFFVLCFVGMILWKDVRAGIRNMCKAIVQKPGKEGIVVGVAFLLVAGIYLMHPFLLEPGHDTAEQVVTILDTGALTGWDALTGEIAPVQGNWKQQLENLPVFYACLCQLFSMTPADVLFGVVPYVVLFGVFCVISMFEKYFFKDEKRSCAWAMLLFALITICGNTAYMNPSFGLLHYPYEAMTMFSSVLLPLTFCLAVKKENPLWFLLVFANAVFAVGLRKALVLFFFQAVCYVIAWVFSRLFERREK